MNSPAAAPRLAAPRLRHTFGGIWRLTFPGFLRRGRLLRLAGLLAGLALLTGATVRTADATVFFDWTIRYLTFLVPVLAFLSGAGAIRDDLKPATVDYVFTRPVSRPAFVVFKFLSHLTGLQANGLLALGVLLGIGVFRHVPGLGAALPLLVLAQVLAVGVFTAFGFLCGTLTPRYLIVGMIYAGTVEIGLGSIPTQINRLSLTHQLKTMLAPLATSAAGPASPAQGPATTAALLLLVSFVMLAASAIVFGQRELAGGKPKEN
jgi:ABC-type transport system involved in multi-copper enzyme maturation permease subunit